MRSDKEQVYRSEWKVEQQVERHKVLCIVLVVTWIIYIPTNGILSMVVSTKACNPLTTLEGGRFTAAYFHFSSQPNLQTGGESA